jgi:hypothetical protein
MSYSNLSRKWVTSIVVVVPLIMRLVAVLLPRRPGFEPRSGHVGFVVDKVTLGHVFSEYFGFPCQFAFHRLLHTHHLSSGAVTIGQLVADVPSELSLTPPQETKKNFYSWHSIAKYLINPVPYFFTVHQDIFTSSSVAVSSGTTFVLPERHHLFQTDISSNRQTIQN